MPSPQPVAVLEQVLQELQQQMRTEQFDTWFRGVELSQLTDDEAEFIAPSGFVRDWLNRNYLQSLQRALQVVTGKDLRVRVRLDPEPTPDDQFPDPTHDPHSTAERATVESGRATHRQGIHEIMDEALGGSSTCGGGEESTRKVSTNTPLPSPGRGDSLRSETSLNEDYTFEQYVVGPCNRLSHAAALAIGQNPGRAYNPLFVHGNVGLGKTHLLQSICHAIKRKPEPARVLYLSCEEFTNKFILSIQMGRLNDFREFYRSADVLVVDDVQFLEGKTKTQEEFFHTFNALYNSHKQIVISSDHPPVEIPTIEERLVSRFKWGLVTDIVLPCLETRLAIVNRKARLKSVELPDEVTHYIAERMTSNIRELEGAVIKVIGISCITETPITLQLAQEALKGLAPNRPNKISVENIFSLITSEFSISARDLTGKGRTQAVSLPRQIGMYLARDHTDHSLEAVGGYFGGRDHTTVLYAVTKIKNRAKSDRMFNELLANLSSRLQSGNFEGFSSKV
jgi:chromosomal replication initiator protein